MKKEIAVLLTENYADWELAFICPELNKYRETIHVAYVGLEDRLVTSMGGLQVASDYTAEEYLEQLTKGMKVDVLLICGGTFWAERNYEAPLAQQLVEQCVAMGSQVAAICDAVTFLAAHAYLNGAKHTGNSLSHFIDHCSDYSGSAFFLEKQCVRDQQFITANGTATLEFAAAIMNKLAHHSKKEIEEWYLFHKKGFYSS